MCKYPIVAFLVSLAAFVWWLSNTTTTEPPPAQSTNKQLAELLAPIRKKHDVPALAAAVVNDRGVVAVAVVGVRKRGDETSATVDDKFHLGSDTKAMTAALVAQFVQKGDLSWNSTLGDTFPELADTMSPEIRKITLTQLLTHHAGFDHDIDGGWGKIPRKGSLRDQRQEAPRRLADVKLLAEPGKKFSYSNVGYVLAGHMAEKAGGTTGRNCLPSDCSSRWG